MRVFLVDNYDPSLRRPNHEKVLNIDPVLHEPSQSNLYYNLMVYSDLISYLVNIVVMSHQT